MNRNFRKWLACAVAVTIAVYNAPYIVEALEVIKDSVQVDSNNSSEEEGTKPEDEQNSDVPQAEGDAAQPEDNGVQSEDGTLAEEGNSENTTEQNNTDGLTQAGAFWVSGAKGTDWTFSDNGELTINSGTGKKIRIVGDGQETKNRVVIEEGYQGTVTIKNLNIDSKGQYSRAFEVQSLDGRNTNVELILEGENTLKSGEQNPGLKFAGKGSGSLLTIKGDGQLTAIGGKYGAGIGGGYKESGNNITISGGIVIATGGLSGAGIGGGYLGSGNNITISGGIVTATGETGGAGIGGGNRGIMSGIIPPDAGNGSNITITGGTVTATGGSDGSGIGRGGGKSGSANNIKIAGGSVKASSISITPKDEDNAENVYLVKLDGQKGIKIVRVNDKNYNVSANHPDDESLYLYMPVGEHTITTNNDTYNVNVSDSGYIFTNSWIKKLSITGWTYGGIANNPSATAKFGNVEFTYSNEKDGNYTSNVPTDAGTYYVKATVKETKNYTGLVSDPVEFEITKATSLINFKDGTSFNKTYNEEPVKVTKEDVKTSGSTGDVSFTFEKKVNDNWETVKESPKEAGTYQVKAILAEDANYNSAESKYLEFTIDKADSKVEITTKSLDKVYDGNAVSNPEYTTLGSNGNVTIKWMKKSENKNWEDLSKAPIEVGNYRVIVELAKNDNYNSASATLEFTIYGKAPEVTEESGKVDISTDRIEINTEVAEGNKDVYFYCTEITKVPNPPAISSKFRKVDEWEKANGSKHVFTGLKPNTTYHIWKYDNAKPEGEKLTYEYSIKTDSPSTPSIPSKPDEKPETGVDIVDKIAGEDRYDTSVSISQKVFPSKSEKVYLVSGEKFPDALSSAALTGKGDGPILLINDKNIDKILSEIDRLDAKEIVFIGGNSVSDANEAKIRKFAKENSLVINSFVGKDRYETSVKVAEQTISKYGNKGKVIIADGRNYPDTVSIASYAAKEGIPVILVNGNKVPDVVKNFLNKYKISNVIIVGGDKAVGKDVEKLFKSVDRVAGDDRYDTSKKIAEKFFAGSKIVFVASGESFADSLSVSYYAGAKNAPILLTKANSLDNDTKEYLEKNKDKEYIIVGGDKAINPDLFK